MTDFQICISVPLIKILLTSEAAIHNCEEPL